jgi:hypothetical protein
MRCDIGNPMTTDEDFVSCSQCGTRIDEPHNTPPDQRLPCPSCGSKARTFNVHLSETVTLREKLGVKQKRPGFKKPIYESVGGDDLHRNTGEWSHLSREIDRLNDRYREKIVSSKTGAVLREVDEPLSQHVNRGSARRRSQPEEGSDA